MIKRWLVFDIGCIECGEESDIVGLYDTKEEAVAASIVASEKQQQHWSGQHEFEIYDLAAFSPAAEESHPEWEACK